MDLDGELHGPSLSIEYQLELTAPQGVRTLSLPTGSFHIHPRDILKLAVGIEMQVPGGKQGHPRTTGFGILPHRKGPIHGTPCQADRKQQ
ncbi:hypothetical protein GCM10027346_41810 [Hymenobacter seoulensis]